MTISPVTLGPGTALRSSTAAGAALLVVVLVITLARPPGGAAWTASTLAAAYVAVLVAHHVLLAERLRVRLSWALPDVVAGGLVALAIACALAARPLQQHSGPGSAAVLLALVPVTLGVLLWASALAGCGLNGGVRDVRTTLFAAASGALVVVEVTALLFSTGVLEPAGPAPGVLTALVRCLAGALLVSAAWRPHPADLAVADQDAHTVVLAPTAYVLACVALLGWDHAAHLPTAVVVASLACVVVTGVKVALVFGEITSLNVTRRQAMTDELTGLGNRRALVARLAAVGAGAPLTLTLVDLDRFKEVNDVLGHDAGDELLRQVAARLLERAGEDELVVRQGGDEFALVAPGPTPAAVARALALVERLGEPFALGTRQVQVAASVGVASAPEHARDAEELQRRADGAMYQAKAAGGGVQVHDRATDAERRREAELVADLRVAVAGDGLTVPSRSWTPPPATSSAWRPWCAGTTPTGACWARRTSCPWPSATGSWTT